MSTPAKSVLPPEIERAARTSLASARGLACGDWSCSVPAQLEKLFAKPVDVVTPSGLTNPYLRQRVEQEKTLLYAA